MKKNLLVLTVMLSTLASTSMCLAFDFQTLDNKIKNGEIAPDQVKQIIDEAVNKGEITKDQVRQHMEKVGKRHHKEFLKRLEKSGISKDEFEATRKQGPEAVKALLESHGIKLPANRPHFGPPPFGKNGMFNKDKFIKKLNQAGISEEDFKTAHEKGPDAVKQLFESHGIKPHEFFHPGNDKKQED